MTPSSARSEDPAAAGRVVAFVDDLMDRSRISAAVPGVEFVRALPPGVGSPDARAHLVAIVDGGRPKNLALVGTLVAQGARVLVFLPHVDGHGAEQARRAGALVLSRNRFFNDVSAGIAKVNVADTGR